MKNNTSAINVKDYVRTHPGLTPEQCRQNLIRHRIPTAEIRKAMADLKVDSTHLKAVGVASSGANAPKAQPLKELLDAFDDVGKVNKALRSLGINEYLAEDELRRRLSITHDRWKEVRDVKSLKPFQFVLPNKKTVWMHTEAQERLRRAIEISSQ
jgi:hypothetical protein